MINPIKIIKRDWSYMHYQDKLFVKGQSIIFSLFGIVGVLWLAGVLK